MVKKIVNLLATALLLLAPLYGMGTAFAEGYPVSAVSTNQNGILSNGPSFASQMTADGTQVAFLSSANNLDPAFQLPNPDGSINYVYLKNLQTGAVHLVSAGTQNQVDTQGWATIRYQMTPDGRHVVFVTNHDLYTGAVGGGFVYERDIQAGVTTQVNLGPDGQTIFSQYFTVSDDGRYVAFSGLPGPQSKLYIRDNQTNVTTQVPVDGTAQIFFSGDGHYLFYESSTDFSTMYRYGLIDGSNVVLNVGNDGTKAVLNGVVSSSTDGSKAVFSTVGPLITSDTNPCNVGNNVIRVYVRDFSADTLSLVDVNNDGSDPAPDNTGQCGLASNAAITPDGTKVVFSSNEGLAGYTRVNGPSQIFVRDLVHDTTTGVSLNSSGLYLGSGVYTEQVTSPDGSITADGSMVSYTSRSDDVQGTDGSLQIYLTPVRVLPHVGTPIWSANPFDPGQTTTLTVAASEISGVPVSGGEYFVDNDPGVGVATPMAYDGANLSATFGSDLSTGPHTVGIRAIDVGGTWSNTTFDTLFVNPENSPPTITSNNTASTGMRTPFDYKITTSGFHPPAITETGTLPSGISLVDNGDGTADVTGMALVGTAGSYPITVTATNASGSADQSFTLTVTTAASNPTFISATDDTEVFGQPFSFTVNTTGYPAPAISRKGALPGGVTFADNGDGTATIAGTPSGNAQGNYPLTFTAKIGTTKVTQSFTLTITRAPVFKAVTGTTATVDQPYTLNIGTKGYTIPSLTISDGLPSDLAFTDNGDGTATISGTPGTAGAYSFTVTATNTNGTATKNITIKVNGPPTQMDSGVSFTPNVKRTYRISVDGYPAPTFTISGTLPASIKFNTTTGTFSGKATASELGNYPLVITATNAYGSITQNFVFRVAYPN